MADRSGQGESYRTRYGWPHSGQTEASDKPAAVWSQAEQARCQEDITLWECEWEWEWEWEWEPEAN